MPMELTEREKLIASGGNPDQAKPDASAAPEPPESEPAASAETEKATEKTQEQAATDGVPSAGSKDAAPDATNVEQPSKDAVRGAAAPEAASSTWITDEHKQLGQSYGLSDEELKGFGSAAEFQRAARFFDRQLVASQSTAQGAAKPATQPAQQATQPASQQQPAQVAEAAKKLDLDPAKYKEAGYDDETIALVEYAKGLRDELDGIKPQLAAIPQMQQAFQEMESRRMMNAFHDTVDAFGDKRFGSTLDEHGRPRQLSQQEDDNRRKLYEQAEILSAGILARAKATGQQSNIPPLAVLLRRAHGLAFGDDIKAEQRKTQADQITEQSRRRRPVAATKPVTAAPRFNGSNLNEVSRSIAESPDMEKLWSRITEENGVAR